MILEGQKNEKDEGISKKKKVMKERILKSLGHFLAEVGRNEALMMGYTLKK